jgi:hypothetical protein
MAPPRRELVISMFEIGVKTGDMARIKADLANWSSSCRILSLNLIDSALSGDGWLIDVNGSAERMIRELDAWLDTIDPLILDVLSTGFDS